MRHQRAADRQHLLLAARQRAARLVAPLLQPREEAEDAPEVRPDLGALRPRPRVGAHVEVFEHRHAREDAAALRRLADAHLDAPVRRDAENVLALEADLSRADRPHPRDRAKRGRLAGAVAADQRDDLALVDVKEMPLSASILP